MIEFILGGINPASAARDAYLEMAQEPGGIFSFERCLVATVGNAVVGMANAFPASLIRNEFPVRNPTCRELLLKPRFELNDWASYLLNNICVATNHRRRGVGTALLKAVVDDAKLGGYPFLSLHVWADNKIAIAFYRSLHDDRNGANHEPADDGARHARDGPVRADLLGRDVARRHGGFCDGLSLQRLDGEEADQTWFNDRS